jgi:predicted HNH restriction endonuclease
MRDNGECFFCKVDDPDVLDFHHIHPEDRRFNVANSWRHYGIKAIKEEIAKCIIVCANCHRKIHAGKLEVPSDFDRS